VIARSNSLSRVHRVCTFTIIEVGRVFMYYVSMRNAHVIVEINELDHKLN
jgi:glycyl-tRNA synthetase beta subunit